jgi:3-oxoacyl-[acyl-carrier protein] reductase
VSMQKTALVTGSARGIGHSTAKLLAENGYHVIVSDVLTAVSAQSVLEDMEGLSCEYQQLDIACAENRKSIFTYIRQTAGRLDVLVNNAGVAPQVRADLLETSPESFDRVLSINLRGTFFMCQAAANAMLEFQKKGLHGYSPRIINIGSISAYTSSTSRAEYCISKAGIGMVTALFADRLANEGIPVFEVRPGIVATDMTKAVTEKYQKLIEEGVTPIKRFGQPLDVAKTVLAACSGLLDFTTGQVLNADGGFHIRRL